MPKYKKGDKVRVKSTLKENTHYFMENKESPDITVNEMVALAGTIVTIIKASNTGYYIEEDYEQYYWTDEMFEPITKVQWRL